MAAIVIILALAVWLTMRFFANKAITPSQNTDSNQVVSLEKISYKDRLTMLQDLFAKKLGKTSDNIDIKIAREDNTHIKGIVTVKGDYEGVFLAFRDSGEWKIVWDGKGIYPCADIQRYGFPAEMVGNCLK